MRSFEFGEGGIVWVGLLPVPYPGWQDSAVGPASLNPEALGRITAHLIVSASGLPELDEAEAHIRSARITAAIGVGTAANSLGVRLATPASIVFREMQRFAMAVAGESDNAVLAEACIDVTMDIFSEPMSLLTHSQ